MDLKYNLLNINMITKDMVILNIIEDYPETEGVFRTYDEIAGKCVMCHNLFDTLDEFALLYSIHIDELIQNLNHVVRNKDKLE